MLTTRIIQLGGPPVTEPKEWYNKTNCGYDAPNDPFVKIILEQNIKGKRYQRLICSPEIHNG